MEKYVFYLFAFTEVGASGDFKVTFDMVYFARWAQNGTYKEYILQLFLSLTLSLTKKLVLNKSWSLKRKLTTPCYLQNVVQEMFLKIARSFMG